MAVSVHADMDGFGLSLGDMKNVGFNLKKNTYSALKNYYDTL